MDDEGQGVHRVAVDEDVELDQGLRPVTDELVVHRGVAGGAGLELVIEVEDDLVEGKLVGQEDALGADVFHLLLLAALALEELEDVAEVLVRRQDEGLDDRLLDLRDSLGIGKLGGVVDLDDLARRVRHPVAHARGRRDEAQLEIPLQPLLDDLPVQEAEEPGPEPEARGPASSPAHSGTRRRSAAASPARPGGPRCGSLPPGTCRRRPWAWLP